MYSHIFELQGILRPVGLLWPLLTKIVISFFSDFWLHISQKKSKLQDVLICYKPK
jgi:hypothetical protein